VNLNFSDDERQFQERLQMFLAQELPAELRDDPLQPVPANANHIRRWQRILHTHGWGAVHWPVQFGGMGASHVQQYLFQLECVLAGAPIQPSFALKMLAPVLMRFASPAQQQFFLPRILNGEHWWCQGYSEPDSGSDLASLKTRAVLDREHYVVSGQKCWNTLGQYADWMFCLVRTDPTVKPQAGISLLLIDMRTPGITVRPTRLLDGTAEVNEIWLEDVRVPLGNRVGEQNMGWTYAKYLLGHERAGIAGVGASKRELRRLKAIAAGCGLIQNPGFRRRLARVEIDLLGLEYFNLRALSAPESDSSTQLASMLKIRGSEIRQALAELLMEAAGEDALRFDPHGATAFYLNMRKLSIFGGTNEIQRNIIANALLGP
jgi:alkylation response protein AidB-like acyl-CoA dehydrogenase